MAVVFGANWVYNIGPLSSYKLVSFEKNGKGVIGI